MQKDTEGQNYMVSRKSVVRLGRTIQLQQQQQHICIFAKKNMSEIWENLAKNAQSKKNFCRTVCSSGLTG